MRIKIAQINFILSFSFCTSPWAQNFPSANSTGHCGAMQPNARLKDLVCDDDESSSSFVCERPLGAPPLCGDGYEHFQGSCYKVVGF